MAEFGLASVNVECPYCGEPIELLADCSGKKQKYIEDCHVCCRPMNVRLTVDEDGFPSVQVSHEDDV
jgi:transposase-like protein